jgi:mono/diheme cytochrome c family protein
MKRGRLNKIVVAFLAVVSMAAASVAFADALSGGTAGGSARVADDSSGKRIFDSHCAECHAAGFGHPGTQRLGWLRGERYAVLTERTDLSADYVRLVVRRGLQEMPPFRPSEISDLQLAELGAYLTKTRPAVR